MNSEWASSLRLPRDTPLPAAFPGDTGEGPKTCPSYTLIATWLHPPAPCTFHGFVAHPVFSCLPNFQALPPSPLSSRTPAPPSLTRPPSSYYLFVINNDPLHTPPRALYYLEITPHPTSFSKFGENSGRQPWQDGVGAPILQMRCRFYPRVT